MIKSIGALAALLGMVCLVLSCGIFSPPDHRIRVQNNNSFAVSISLGDVDYGTINPGALTSYKSVDEGKHDLSGSYTGFVEVSGNGKHKWTLSLDGNSVTIEED